MAMNFRTFSHRRQSGPAQGAKREQALLSRLRSIRAPRQLTAEETREILQVLAAAPSPRVVAAAAFALAEARTTTAIEPLIGLLRRSVLENFPETTLYAINELGGTLPIDVLVDVLSNGPSEAREEAMMFLDDDRLDLSGADLDTVRDRLAELSAGSDSDRAEAADEVLDHLRDLALRPGP